MKNVKTFDQFVNESVNEMFGKEYGINSIGRTDLITGKSKWWNIYDEWKEYDDDTTCEIYIDHKTGKMNRFVFTSGKKAIGDIKPGETRVFTSGQSGRYIFDGEFVEGVLLKDLKKWAQKNKVKSGTGYTYQ